MFGLTYDGLVGPFAPVRLNASLTLDFDDRRREFESIFSRVKAQGLPYGSEPYAQTDMQVREFNGGRTVYFHELNGHLLEIRTKTSAEDIARMKLDAQGTHGPRQWERRSDGSHR